MNVRASITGITADRPVTPARDRPPLPPGQAPRPESPRSSSNSSPRPDESSPPSTSPKLPPRSGRVAAVPTLPSDEAVGSPVIPPRSPRVALAAAKTARSSGVVARSSGGAPSSPPPMGSGSGSSRSIPMLGRRGLSAHNTLAPSVSAANPADTSLATERPVDPAYGERELRAGRIVLGLLRRWYLRRAWNRLVRYSVMHTRLDHRVGALKTAELQRRAALVIWRAWKASRSFSGLVFKTVKQTRETEKRQYLTRTFESDTVKLGSEEHVDWRDLDEGRAMMSMLEVRPDARDVQLRLTDILGFEPVSSATLEDSCAALIVMEETECSSCRAKTDTNTACRTCQRFACGACSIALAGGARDCLLCHSRMGGGAMQALLSPPVETRAGDLSIDACSLDALVFFITNSAYRLRKPLADAMLGTMAEWAPSASDRGAFFRGLHCRHRADATAAPAIMDVMLGYLARHGAAGEDELRQYVVDCEALVGARDDADNEFFRAVQSALTRHRHNRRHRNVDPLLIRTTCSPQFVAIPPARVPPVSLSDLSSIELARQRTLIDFHVYSKVHRNELMNTAWSSKQKERRAMNVLMLTRAFNDFSRWICHSIVSGSSPAVRAKTISYFIDVQQNLLHLNNLHGVMAVHAALCSSAVARLQKSWAAVAPVLLVSFGRCDRLMSPQLNYKEYRKLLADALPGPCIPYIGVDLTALTMLGEQQTHMAPPEGSGLRPLINTCKLMKMAAALDVMEQLQGRPYPLVPHDGIQAFVLAREAALVGEGLTDVKLYEESLLREPRQGATESKRRGIISLVK